MRYTPNVLIKNYWYLYHSDVVDRPVFNSYSLPPSSTFALCQINFIWKAQHIWLQQHLVGFPKGPCQKPKKTESELIRFIVSVTCSKSIKTFSLYVTVLPSTLPLLTGQYARLHGCPTESVSMKGCTSGTRYLYAVWSGTGPSVQPKTILIYVSHLFLLPHHTSRSI